MSYLEEFLTWLGKQDKETLFKDCQGKFRTNSLFYEIKNESLDEPIFTIKDRHHGKYWSFQRLYLEIGDLTEYRVGEMLLYSIEHLDRFNKNAAIKAVLNKCRDKLERKLRSEAVMTISDLRNSKDGKLAMAAAKFIAKKEYINDRKTKTGLLTDKKFALEVEKELDDAYNLLGLNDDSEQVPANQR